MDVTPRDPLPPNARTLPARYYVDPVHFVEERERFFAGMWTFVGREDEVSRPGDAILRDVAGENLIIVRGDDREIRAFYNVCRHRGTRLLTEPSSCVGKRIQCPYHAWTFDLQGRLVAAPQMDEGPRFRKEDYPLKSVGLDRWDGHLFVHLGDHPPPLADQLGDLPTRFAAWGMGGLVQAHRITYDVAANWKLIVQNFSECLHCPVIHPALQGLTHYLSGDNEPATSGYLGGLMTLRDGIETLSLDGKSTLAVLPGLNQAERRKVAFYVVLPNLMLSLHPDYILTHRLTPTACNRTEIVFDVHVQPHELARPDFDISSIIAFWDLTNRQDWHVSELTQLGLNSRAYSPGPYSDREDLLYAFDRLIARPGDGS
jgi:Rieske 2Fe-2S family protein